MSREEMRLFRRLEVFNRLRAFRAMRREEGNTLVEMALACTILLAMLFGIFEMSIALYTYHYVSDAAREGARWAIVRGNTCIINTPALDHCGTTVNPGASVADIQTHVQDLGYPGIDSTDNMTVTTTWLTGSTPSDDGSGNPVPTTWSACGTTYGCKSPGNQVQVRVVYRYPLNVPFIPRVTLPVHSTSTMVISQ